MGSDPISVNARLFQLHMALMLPVMLPVSEEGCCHQEQQTSRRHSPGNSLPKPKPTYV